MRPIRIGSPTAGNEQQFVLDALRDIEMASNETTDEIYDGVVVTGLTQALELRTLDVGSATLSDLVRVVATIIADHKKRGAYRSDV